jgi:monoterpene epsilon-lactone hydrolase
MSTSLAARALVWALRAQRRQRKYASVEGLHERIRSERATETFEPPRSLFDTFPVSRVIRRTHHGMPFFSLLPNEATPSSSGLCLVYLHGGAYVSEVAPQHWGLVADLSRRLGCEVVVPVYPLAPEHHAAEVVATVLALVEHLQDARNGKAGRLVIAGDSAGGGLALAVTQALIAKGRRVPDGLVLLSPWLDGTVSHEDVARIAQDDPWLAVPGLVEAARLYAGDEAPACARVSPLFGSFAGLPRTLVLAGTRDVLFPDAQRYFTKSLEESVDTTFLRYEDMVHVWMLVEALPEAQEARRRIVEWLRA